MVWLWIWGSFNHCDERRSRNALNSQLGFENVSLMGINNCYILQFICLMDFKLSVSVQLLHTCRSMYATTNRVNPLFPVRKLSSLCVTNRRCIKIRFGFKGHDRNVLLFDGYICMCLQCAHLTSEASNAFYFRFYSQSVWLRGYFHWSKNNWIEHRCPRLKLSGRHVETQRYSD